MSKKNCGSRRKATQALPKVTMSIKPQQESKRIVTRDIEGNMILMTLVKSSLELNYIYMLNKTAAIAWHLFNGKTSLGDIASNLIQSYSVTEGRLERELTEFIKDLASFKAITYLKGESKITPKPEAIKKSTQKKLPWIPLKITRVKLDLSQAVPSCCAATSRGPQSPGPLAFQCAEPYCNPPSGIPPQDVAS